MNGKLSEREAYIVEFISAFTDEHRFHPTIFDILVGCDINSISELINPPQVDSPDDYEFLIPEFFAIEDSLESSEGEYDA